MAGLLPGDAREDHAQAAGGAVAAIYEQVELALIAAAAVLARKAAMGTLAGAVAQRQLARTTQAVFAGAAPRIRTAIHGAYVQAQLGARSTVVDALGREGALRMPLADVSPLAQSLDAANSTATASIQQVLADAVASTRGGLPGTSLSLSRIQAAQTALSELGERGITGFTDRSGRRWDLTAYVEMATRTAVSNAWDDMQAAAMARSGLDLVQVYTHSLEGSCRHCLPWLGRTLSLTGATPGHPTLTEAKNAGFRHPNCRCSWMPLGAGLAAEVTSAVALGAAAAAYRASQQQRAHERRVREAGRRAHAAITPQAKARARRDLAAAQAASAAHRHRTGLVMTKVGARRREHPFRAR